jgi:hypothetical protein
MKICQTRQSATALTLDVSGLTKFCLVQKCDLIGARPTLLTSIYLALHPPVNRRQGMSPEDGSNLIPVVHSLKVGENAAHVLVPPLP